MQGQVCEPFSFAFALLDPAVDLVSTAFASIAIPLPKQAPTLYYTVDGDSAPLLCAEWLTLTVSVDSLAGMTDPSSLFGYLGPAASGDEGFTPLLEADLMNDETAGSTTATFVFNLTTFHELTIVDGVAYVYAKIKTDAGTATANKAYLSYRTPNQV